MKEIDKNIMDCKKWGEIKDLIEGIISVESITNFKYMKYMKYIDARKKNKNWETRRHYEKNRINDIFLYLHREDLILLYNIYIFSNRDLNLMIKMIYRHKGDNEVIK